MRRAAKMGAMGFVMALALLASGCFRIEQFVDLSVPDTAGMTLRLWVQESFAGSEMDLFLNQLALTVPAIRESARFRKTTASQGVESYVVFEWVAKERHPVEGMPFTLTSRPDGSYEFRYLIGPFEGFSERTQSDSILMTVQVLFPREVDFANTMVVRGKMAQWDLRKADLASGVTLRAITR